MEVNKAFFKKLKSITPEENISEISITKIKREKKNHIILSLIATAAVLFLTPSAIQFLLTEMDSIGTLDLLKFAFEDSRFFLDNLREVPELVLTALPIAGFSVNLALLTVLAVIAKKTKEEYAF